MRVTAITHRADAIYPTTVVGRFPKEDCYLAKTTERLFLPVIRTFVPEVVDLNLPLFGVFHNWAFVSIRKTHPHQAHKVMHALWGLGQMMYTKFLVVVDADVNVQNPEEVLWRVGAEADPKRDAILTTGPADVLDHAAPRVSATPTAPDMCRICSQRSRGDTTWRTTFSRGASTTAGAPGRQGRAVTPQKARSSTCAPGRATRQWPF